MALSLPTVAAVRSIFTTNKSDEDIQSVMADAALYAEGCPVVATYDATRQAAIVKWLTAHLLSSSSGKGALTQKSLGDASESYAQPSMTAGLSSSQYGQQAINLDPSGCLASLGKRKPFVQVASRLCRGPSY